MQLIRTVLHDNPAATVIELLSNPGELPNAAMSKIPTSAILQAKAVLDELTRGGVQAKAYRGDISDETSFLAARKQCSQQLPPVKGVIQMAMVL